MKAMATDSPLPKDAPYFAPPDGVDVRLVARSPRLRYVTTTPHTYGWNGWETIIPEGFEFDGLTLPAWFRVLYGLLSVFDPGRRFFRAVLLHDYLYRKQVFSRWLADAFFRAVLHNDLAKAQYPLAFVMFYAVRLFGWVAWNANTEAQRKAADNA